MRNDEYNEAQKRNDKTNVGEGFQDYTIIMRGRRPCEILHMQVVKICKSLKYASYLVVCCSMANKGPAIRDSISVVDLGGI